MKYIKRTLTLILSLIIFVSIFQISSYADEQINSAPTLVKEDDIWYYTVDGEKDDTYTGLVKYYYTWYYVKDGVLNWDYTGLTKYYGTWYYVNGSILNWDYTGLTKYYGTWYYVNNGILNWDYTGLTKYYGTWYYVNGGILNWDYTGLTKYYGTWYYVNGGILDWSFNGATEYYGTWYYVNGGILDWSFNCSANCNGIISGFSNGQSNGKNLSNPINVNVIYQNPELPTGCEITSLTMVLNFYGCNADKCYLADHYLDKGPRGSGNPWIEFLGNPRNSNDLGCYAPVIVNSAKKYISDYGRNLSVKDISGSEAGTLYQQIDKGCPVIVWVTDGLRAPHKTSSWVAADGTAVSWISPMHCVVLTGYDYNLGTVTFADPLHGTVSYPMSTFENVYNTMMKQAIVIQ